MRNTSFARRVTIVIVIDIGAPLVVSCSGGDAKQTPITNGSGGVPLGGGGVAQAAGASASGGTGNPGGSLGSGGMLSSVNGGAPASGGSSASGGAAGIGGQSSGGAGGASPGGTGNSGGGAGGAGNGGGGAGGTSAGAFALTSPDHAEGTKFGDKFTCALAGFNGSLLPELRWTAGPSGTKSYAITFIDVTLTKGTPPNMNGYHWAIWNIPATTTRLAGGFKDASSIGASQTGSFLGPCPNIQGSGHVDTYEFTIYALGTDTLGSSPTPGTAGVKAAETKLEMTHLASAKLTGTSDAKPP